MFLYPALLTALALIALPILIHLINLFRHRRVEWAAMEFLLASFRKHSKWIRMREALLLLCRICIVALIVLAAAVPLVSDQWGRILGGQKTNLIFLLDDSYSMRARSGETTCFEQAKSALLQFFADQNISPGQTVTIIAFSKPDAPILSAPVDSKLTELLEQTLENTYSTQRDDSPENVLHTAADWVESNKQSAHRIFLISDFRQVNWLSDNGKLSEKLRQEVERLTSLKATVSFIDVSGQSGDESRRSAAGLDRINIGIAALKPGSGTIAAGVPIPMTVEAINHSSTAAKNVSIRLETDGKPLPAALIHNIEPGETGRANFTVSYPQGGCHTIKATLSADGLDADNERFCVLDVPARVSTLLIGYQPRTSDEPDPSHQPDVRFVQTALAPGAPVDTGLACRVENDRFLNAANLDEFKTVYLLNVRGFSNLAGENLLQWLRKGGTAVVFLGDKTDASSWNSWVEKVEELKELKLSKPQALPPDFLRKRSDLNVFDNPIFRIFEGEKNAFLAAVNVNTYYALESPEAVEKHTLAQLRNGAPLMVETPIGDGAIVVFLTSAAPTWNNWGKGNPSYIVVLHQLQAELINRNVKEDNHLVGRPIEFEFNSKAFTDQFQCTVPPPENEAQLDLQARQIDLTAQMDKDVTKAVLPDVPRSGVYRFKFQPKPGVEGDSTSVSDVKDVAVNVAVEEGNLKKLDLNEFKRSWSDIPLEIADSATVSALLAGPQGFNLQPYCLYALILLMILEMLIAYWASSHLAHVPNAVQKGGAR